MTDPLTYDGKNPVLKEVQKQTRKAVKAIDSNAQMIYICRKCNGDWHRLKHGLQCPKRLPEPVRVIDYIRMLEGIMTAIVDQQKDGIDRKDWIVREAKRVSQIRIGRKGKSS